MHLFIPAQHKVCYSSVSRDLTWISNRQLRTSHFLLNPEPLRHASHPVLSKMSGASLHAWATLYRRSVSAALMLPLSDHIAQVEIASRQTERKSVCEGLPSDRKTWNWRGSLFQPRGDGRWRWTKHIFVYQIVLSVSQSLTQPFFFKFHQNSAKMQIKCKNV